jgi:hypothetical protein
MTPCRWLRSRPFALRRIANKLLDKAEQGDLAAAREVIDRTDGKAIQSIDYGELPVEKLSDAQLYEIILSGVERRTVDGSASTGRPFSTSALAFSESWTDAV